MPNYGDGKIYKIENNTNDLIYYGSTTVILCKRMAEHRGKHNNCMSKNLGVDLKFCRIILVENFSCNNKEELTAREAYYIRNFPCVNKNIPGRTSKEYREDNKEKLNEKKKEYREKLSEKNKEKILEKQKERYEKNKENILEKQKEYRETNKEKILERRKEYRKENKEKISEKTKEYRETNKEKLSEKRKEKYTCEKCGATVIKEGKVRHEKTQKHKNKK